MGTWQNAFEGLDDELRIINNDFFGRIVLMAGIYKTKTSSCMKFNRTVIFNTFNFTLANRTKSYLDVPRIHYYAAFLRVVRKTRVLRCQNLHSFKMFPSLKICRFGKKRFPWLLAALRRSHTPFDWPLPSIVLPLANRKSSTVRNRTLPPNSCF